MFFSGWPGLLRTLIVGALAYVALVALLRLSGQRTLSKMNAFDLVVTVALGSTLATVLLSKDVALAEGVLAFSLLIGLQFVVTWSSVRVSWVRRAVTGEPRMLLCRGEPLPDALRRARRHRGRVESRRAASRSRVAAGCGSRGPGDRRLDERGARERLERRFEPGPALAVSPLLDMSLLKYFSNLATGKLVLWCYLVWYLATVVALFDPSPWLWINSLGISLIIGLALQLSVSRAGREPGAPIIGRPSGCS